MAIDDETLQLGKQIWDYHHLDHQIEKADAIIALGSHDLRVATRAAELFLDGLAPWLIMSGGLGNHTANIWTLPEARLFADVAIEMGVPQEKILIEDQSTNTGENIIFTERLLAEEQIPIERAILVQKPYMERRTFATAAQHWPDKTLMVTSQQVAFEDYPTEAISLEDILHIMVGDLQRIAIYPEKGFQIPQEIPAEIWIAYERLVALGFNRHLCASA